MAGFGLGQLADHARVIDVQEARTGGQHISATDRGARGTKVAMNLERAQHLELAACTEASAVQQPGQDINPEQLIPGRVPAVPR